MTWSTSKRHLPLRRLRALRRLRGAAARLGRFEAAGRDSSRAMRVLRERSRLAVAAGVNDDDLSEAIFEGLEFGRAEQSAPGNSSNAF